MLTHGADVNIQAENGESPLHWVETIETAERLVAHGANLSAANNKGESVLHTAITIHWYQIKGTPIQFFLAKGVNLEAKTRT